MPFPQDPHPVPGSNGVPVYRGWWLFRRSIGWECAKCDGSGWYQWKREEPRKCPRCDGSGVL